MDLLSRLQELPPSTANAVIAGAIAVGTLACFLGYRTLKFLIGFMGFAIAGVVATAITGMLSGGNEWVMLAGGLIGGFCGATALFFLFRLGVFLMGASGAGLIAHQVLQIRGDHWALWGVIGIALVGGLLAMLMERPIISLATASIGAWVVVCGVAFFLLGPEVIDAFSEPLELGQNRTAMLGAWAVLAIAGTVAQFATTRKVEKVETVVVEKE